MTLLKSAVAAAAMITITAAAALAQSSPYGVWTRPSTGTKVEFSNCGGKLCAKIVSAKDAKTVGTQIMKGASKSGDNTWTGDLLNTEDGKTYSGVVTLDGPKALTLKGCVLGGIICKGETWTR